MVGLVNWILHIRELSKSQGTLGLQLLSDALSVLPGIDVGPVDLVYNVLHEFAPLKVAVTIDIDTIEKLEDTVDELILLCLVCNPDVFDQQFDEFFEVNSVLKLHPDLLEGL